MLMHTDAYFCMLMHSDACMLMHADEYWCLKYVDDVFLEHHLQIRYIDFVYFDCDLYTFVLSMYILYMILYTLYEIRMHADAY